jgi:hypothetical protein
VSMVTKRKAKNTFFNFYFVGKGGDSSPKKQSDINKQNNKIIMRTAGCEGVPQESGTVHEKRN